jgi:pimeloyl-ACP methyl ester carboxylesterase/streptogramin lyase
MRKSAALSLIFVLAFVLSTWTAIPAVHAAVGRHAAARKVKTYKLKGTQVSGSLAVDAKGNLYIDSGNPNLWTGTDSVVKLSPKGKVLARWDGLGVDGDHPDQAAGIALDANGDLFVADVDANTIVKLSPSLTVLGQWGGEGSSPGKFVLPEGVAIDGAGNVYVADMGNGRVQKFSPDGAVLAVWDNTQIFRNPLAIAINRQGTIYVLDNNIDGLNRIDKLAPDGSLLAHWDLLSLSSGHDLAVDRTGNLYVADVASEDILKLSPKGKELNLIGPAALDHSAVIGVAVSPKGVVYDSECNDAFQYAVLCRAASFTSKGFPSAIWQSAAEPKAPGMRIDLGGYKMYIRCTGTGSPTVIFDDGWGGDSREWSWIQPQIASQTRVCSYDRTGWGLSDQRPNDPHPTGQEIVHDLHTLLAKANVPGPYIMVGHSGGGLHARQFTMTYRSVVVGLVLVESVNENQWGPNPPADNGIIQLAATVQEMHGLTHGVIKGSLGALPLIALTQNADMQDCSNDCFAPAAQWDPFQDELASASTNSVHVMAMQSGHNMPLERPGLVVEAVREVLAAARASSHTLSTCGATFQQLGGQCMP